MKKISIKKYNNFTEFNNDACYLTEYIRNNTENMTDPEKIDYARQVFNKNILNSYIIIGHLPQTIKNFLIVVNMN